MQGQLKCSSNLFATSPVYGVLGAKNIFTLSSLKGLLLSIP